jgi:hypothetical protein
MPKNLGDLSSARESVGRFYFRRGVVIYMGYDWDETRIKAYEIMRDGMIRSDEFFPQDGFDEEVAAADLVEYQSAIALAESEIMKS